MFTVTIDVATQEDVFERLDSIRKDYPGVRFEGAGEFTESLKRECPQVIVRTTEAGAMRDFLASHYQSDASDDFAWTGVSPNLPAIEPEGPTLTLVPSDA